VSGLVETSLDGHVALCRLNRPDARNALSPELMDELATAVEGFDADPRSVRRHRGSDEVSPPATSLAPERSSRSRAPSRLLLAAPRGSDAARRGGLRLRARRRLRLALICDLIVASETAEFGQPEITLGIIPGGGGTQRLARVIGKQRAMELVLTGRRMDAAEAERYGLVNEVAPEGDWLDRAMDLAQRIAKRPPIAVRLAKQAVIAADESGLSEGLEHERRLYELAMATEDRIEGMGAFLEKRKPDFKGR
jgi:enoyl-CoA hydratase/carnithine racemase